MNKVHITKQGAEKLQTELTELKKVTRPRIIKAIATAREHGDLKENAEYHAAREQQSFAEGRIQEIEGKLSNAQIIDVSTITATGKVIFGATVNIIDLADDSEMTYHIVGEDEANIKQGKLNINSPIARALIGKEEGDVVDVKTPGGDKELEIVTVKLI